ncbi:hypothetical protein ACQR2C_22870, partial [Bradyrhizobium sp. HKCCYLRH3061]
SKAIRQSLDRGIIHFRQQNGKLAPMGDAAARTYLTAMFGQHATYRRVDMFLKAGPIVLDFLERKTGVLFAAHPVHLAGPLRHVLGLLTRYAMDRIGDTRNTPGHGKRTRRTTSRQHPSPCHRPALRRPHRLRTISSPPCGKISAGNVRSQPETDLTKE